MIGKGEGVFFRGDSRLQHPYELRLSLVTNTPAVAKGFYSSA